MDATNIMYSKTLKILIQVYFLLTYGDVGVFYALSLVGFKGIVRIECGRRTVHCSLITNMIYRYIYKDNKLFKDNTLFCMNYRCIRKKFTLVYISDILAQYFHQYNLQSDDFSKQTIIYVDFIIIPICLIQVRLQ